MECNGICEIDWFGSFSLFFSLVWKWNDGKKKTEKRTGDLNKKIDGIGALTTAQLHRPCGVISDGERRKN